MDMSKSFCSGAIAQLASCRQAAHDCDAATLQSEAHSMKGSALVCCATQLANLCGALERMARIEQETILGMTDTSSVTSSPSKSPEYWKVLVDDVAECLDELVLDMNALTSMHSLPSFGTLTDVCGKDTDAIAGALCNLLGAAVNAYVAAHAAIFKDEECSVGEVSFGVAIHSLSLACTLADALSVREVVRTARVLSDHLATCHRPPSLETTSTKVQQNLMRVQSEHMLDDVRVTVECLAAELHVILGERMPVLTIPFADEDPQSTVQGAQGGSLRALESSGTNMPVGWVSKPICDYSALLQSTGDDHTFVSALLCNFNDSLSVFSDSLTEGFDRLTEQKQGLRLFDAQSLHGAAVSMFAPRVVDAISTFIVATVGAHKHNDDSTITCDIVDSSLGRIRAEDSAVERAIGDMRAAIVELTHFLRAVESGEPPLRAMMREVALVSGEPRSV